MPKASDYSKGFIYKIVCNDINVLSTYTGSSTDFVKRKSQHKSRCNKEGNEKYNLYVYQVIRENGGWSNWTMLKICDFSCDTKFELEVEERRHMEILGSDMNKRVPTQTQKEYRDAHKEEAKAYQKEYKIINKTKMQHYEKERYEIRKEYVKQKSIANYLLNKEEINRKSKQYQQDNRDKINARIRTNRKLKQQAKLNIIVTI